MRDLDLYEVYSHELGPIPWAIATPHGTLYKTSKPLLLEELEKGIPSIQAAREGSVWIIDVFASIQTLKQPTSLIEGEQEENRKSNWKPNTFHDISDSILSSMIAVAKPSPARIDFVIDTYIDLSIKEAERQKRTLSEGYRIKIASSAQKAPSSWNDYLKHNGNKTELPEFLFHEWSADTGGIYAKRIGATPFYVCHGMKCHRLSVRRDMKCSEVPNLSSNLEEADTRLFFHAKHASDESAAHTIIIMSSDTDVMVLAIYFQREIQSSILMQRQANKKKWKFVDIRSIQHQLGSDICQALPGFHAFSGCDTTSGFVGKTKKSFFKLLTSKEPFRDAMKNLGNAMPVTDSLINGCKAAICKLYKSECDDVNRVRYDMLSKGAESHELPPTKDALVLHIKRANYQSHIWKMSLVPGFVAPSPTSHGWLVKDGVLTIQWMTKDPAPTAVLEFISCKNCQKCSTRRCPCKRNGFKCTDSCKCDINTCENSEDSGRHIIVEDSDTDTDDD